VAFEPPLDLLGVARWPPPAFGEAAATPRGGREWGAAISSGKPPPAFGEAVATPRGGRGWCTSTLGGHPIGWGWPNNPFLFFFFLFFFKISLFIYLVSLYFFIKMDMCCHLIGLMWRWRDVQQNMSKNLTEFDSRDRFVIIIYLKNFSCTF
jgi:hypothetical protein